MKAAAPAGAKISAPVECETSSAGSSRPQTPDNASVAGSTDGASSSGVTANGLGASISGTTGNGDESTLRDSSASLLYAQSGKSDSDRSDTGKGKGRSVTPSITSKNDAGGKDVVENSHSSTENLVGKLNNLVTTDLNNIVEGRDFILIRE